MFMYPDEDAIKELNRVRLSYTKETAKVIRDTNLQSLAIIAGTAEGQFTATEIQDAYFMLRAWICNATDALTKPE